MGAGIGGMAPAARLQARGLSTIVFEAHGQPGGCAGFFRRRGFAFDVGATTLVDFEPGGVGGELLDSVGLPPVEGEALPGYVAWLPDRRVTLYRDTRLWAAERLRTLGDTPAHRPQGGRRARVRRLGRPGEAWAGRRELGPRAGGDFPGGGGPPRTPGAAGGGARPRRRSRGACALRAPRRFSAGGCPDGLPR